MASRDKRLPANVEGDFFVDETCIDCGTCRWVAPSVYDRAGGHSRVHAQPAEPAAIGAALEALVSCPTGSIGTESRHDLKAVVGGFPRPIDGPVHHCGFHAESSFGAASWLLCRDDGNVLIDSPRYNKPLADRIEAMGGVRWLFLTHRDDVADHERWAERFGCERILHRDDVTAKTRSVERQIAGTDPVPLADDLLIVPVPGHTRGSACLLASERWLFTGDHLAFSLPRGSLTAFRSACWYDWGVQTESMARLLDHRFTWVLPGHGAPVSLEPGAMQAALTELLDWMRGA
jgi:glyoxylase-like metal-dependent hydrolase (beta-lactamase superfamily II)/ferredoxin